MNKRLHFMHIFKTGGTSFWHFAASQFEVNDVCPAVYLSQAPQGTSPIYVLNNISLDKILQYRFFMGHLGWIPRTFFPENEMETITFLRDPLERVLSEYAQICRWRDKIVPRLRHINIDEYIKDAFYISNRQTLYFCLDKGFKDYYDEPLFDSLNFDLLGLCTRLLHLQNEQPDILQLATQRLNKCAFVGITERLDESLERLCDQYSWLLPRNIPKENASSSRIQHQDLSAKTRDRIMELNQLDTKLYQEALKIYEDRFRLRVSFDREPFKQTIYESLPVKNEIHFTFEDRIIGDGWGAREYISTQFHCWSTALTSTLIFSIHPEDNLSVNFHVLHSLVSSFEQKLVLLANDYQISISYTEHAEGGFLFTGLIPVKVFQPESTLLKLTFSLPSLICPKDVNSESDDTRQLGFICKSIEIKPISTSLKNEFSKKGSYALLLDFLNRLKTWFCNDFKKK